MCQKNKLSDYQIAQVFGDTLSLIYKAKCAEINENLQPVYAHLDKLDQPKYTDLDRWFARQVLPPWAKSLMQSLEHINKIRNIHKKIKNNDDVLDVQRAKAKPILSFYNPERKVGRLVTCPFHQDDTPSMLINKNNTVKCYSCQLFTDSIGLFQKLNNVGFKEAVRQLCL